MYFEGALPMYRRASKSALRAERSYRLDKMPHVSVKREAKCRCEPASSNLSACSHMGAVGDQTFGRFCVASPSGIYRFLF